jgi:cyanate permease
MYVIQFVNYFSAVIGVVLSLFIKVNHLPTLFFVLNVLYGIAIIIGNTVYRLDTEMHKEYNRDRNYTPTDYPVILALCSVLAHASLVLGLLMIFSWYESLFWWRSL